MSGTKQGSSSPWAVFDAWGADRVHSEPAPEDLAMLNEKILEIPSYTGQVPEPVDKEQVTAILDSYERVLKSRSSVHFGYPYNLRYNHEELNRFMKFSINNLGDPFVTSNYGVHSREFERSVVDFFAKLWKIERPDYWGYVTTCGTEGNLHGILLARETLPDGILYTSRETHYSIFKAARYYRMECEPINTLSTGEIDYEHLTRRLEANKGKPAIINCNIGTTVKGAVDNLDRILRILDIVGIPREKFYIHCDGALFALMMPFVQYAPEISFNKPIDSIAVSGHKMLGCPMPCGVTICRSQHVKNVEQRIDYLNSVDTTIMGSRNGQAPLFMWYSLKCKGVDGIKKDVEHCMKTAVYLWRMLKDNGITARLNDLSSTVVMERPVDQSFVLRWQLACEKDIAHVVVMPNVTKDKIDVFVEEFVKVRAEKGAMQEQSPTSPLANLRSGEW